MKIATKYPAWQRKHLKKKVSDKSIAPVLKKRICSGCGACSFICPTNCIEFVYGERFNFPTIDTEKCCNCNKCLKVCPSAFLLHGTKTGCQDQLRNESVECFMAHCSDNDVRLDAASGGFITGLILHLMERSLADGAIVTRCEGNSPLVAESFIATDREGLLCSRGSKYAPVSSCTALRDVLKKPGRYVFVGTPCMVEGLIRLQKQLPELQNRIMLTISFVCAGMPSRLATRNYIERDGGVNVRDARRISYRGGGWPGRFRVYGEADRLLMDRPLIGGSLTHLVGIDHYLRCENCLDHWAHFADIAVSDPWCQDLVKNETKGRSAVMVRTMRGKVAVSSAIQDGSLVADRITLDEMLGYNSHLVINSKHERHSWMGLYQLFFFRRLRYILPLLQNLLGGRLVGMRTTVRARFKRKYFY